MKGGLLIVLLMAGLMASCAPFSRQIMSQVDETLTYQVVQKGPDRYVGKNVLWGGVIAEITNKQNETDLKVRETELDIEKRPKNPDRSAGRFIVRYAGFLDPAIFQPGREITVAGEVVGKEVLPLEKILYPYPVILAKEIHLWEKLLPVRPYYSYYWDPFGGPYGYPYRWYRPYYYWW
jgi:outer membrane lipoprotein